MSLLQFAATCLGVLIVTHFWWAPRLRRSIRERPTYAALPKVARLAVVRYVRGVALAGLVTSLSVAGVLEFLRTRSSPAATAGAIHAALVREQKLKQALDAAHPYWFTGVALLLASALGVYIYRRRYVQCDKALAAARAGEVDRLVRAMSQDPHWWDLAPDAEMQRIMARFNTIKEALPKLPTQLQPEALKSLDTLKQMLVQTDILRRMDVRVDPDAIEDPEPETWRDWAAGLVGSPRVAGLVRGSSRAVYRLNSGLLVLGLIGFQSYGVARLVQDRLVTLGDLSVRVNRLDELESEVDQAEADARQETPEASRTPSTNTVPRAATRSAEVAEKIERIQAEIEKAKTSRPEYEVLNEASERVAVEADLRAAQKQRFNEIIAEIHKPTVEPRGNGDGGRPDGPDGPDRGPGSGSKEPDGRLARLREKLDAEAERVDRGDPLKPKAVELQKRTAAIVADADLNPLARESALLESQATRLKAEVGARPRSLAERVGSVGKLPGREAEIAELSGRIDRLRSDTGRRYDVAVERIKALRTRVEAARVSRMSEVEAMRRRWAGLVDRVAPLDAWAETVPARVDAARTRLASAEARAEWERVRQSDVAQRALSPSEFEATKVLARAYEVTLGESTELRGAVPQPEAETSMRLRGLATRQAILGHAQKVAPSARLRPPGLSETPGLSDRQRTVVRSAESVFQDNAPRTRIGQAMQEQLVREAGLSTKLREAVVREAEVARAQLKATVNAGPRSPPGRRLWGELSLSALDAAVERVAGPAVADAVGEISRSALADFVLARRYQFIKDVAGDEGLAKALSHLRAGDPKSPLPGAGRDYLRQVNAPDGDYAGVVRAVGPYEPAIEIAFEPGVNLERAGSIVLEQAAKGKPAESSWRAQCSPSRWRTTRPRSPRSPAWSGRPRAANSSRQSRRGWLRPRARQPIPSCPHSTPRS